ncbi:transcriptional regulator, GntR family [Roseovarius nanhaiticus]|uniref:Transcriptional regulator, GntR family n=1 Tax=Roseovarius nanhaiticus TaxID=573024 RepID=A0A1N7G3Q1_9RHOB|nr:transcriptional regulator, GntR family [Roseovarius nanhaiticus]SIS07197.1 transcriptional regulator, GntR family [Roseovarius nanhaiticus]
MTADAKMTKAMLYDHLRMEILSTRMAPGADVDEAALSARFSISRTPLREVLRQLAGEGYVVLRENRSVRVTDMSFATMRDFFVAAPMIYGAVLRLAARNARPGQLDALHEAQARFKSALSKGTAVDRALANNRFHEVTGEMAGNIYLLPSFQRLLIDHARIGTTFYRPQSNEMADNLNKASHQHDEIIAAIAAGDELRAGQLADEHWNLSRGQIELFVMPGSLDLPLGALPKATTG